MLAHEWVRKLIERCRSRLGASRSAIRMMPPRLGCWASAGGVRDRITSAAHAARMKDRIMVASLGRVEGLGECAHYGQAGPLVNRMSRMNRAWALLLGQHAHLLPKPGT